MSILGCDRILDADDWRAAARQLKNLAGIVHCAAEPKVEQKQIRCLTCFTEASFHSSRVTRESTLKRGGLPDRQEWAINRKTVGQTTLDHGGCVLTCRAHMQQMNEWGWWKCWRNRKTIAAWLAQAARHRGHQVDQARAIDLLKAAFRELRDRRQPPTLQPARNPSAPPLHSAKSPPNSRDAFARGAANNTATTLRLP